MKFRYRNTKLIVKMNMIMCILLVKNVKAAKSKTNFMFFSNVNLKKKRIVKFL